MDHADLDFWVVTVMAPWEETRRWTVRGPAGCGGIVLARRAPLSLGRSADDTGQAAKMHDDKRLVIVTFTDQLYLQQ